MATIRLARESDREAWNSVAHESPQATYAHTWEWKQTLERGLNAESLCLVAEEKGALVGIYPGFLWKRFERSGRLGWLKTLMFSDARVLWSPLFMTWDYGGPCLKPGTSGEVQAHLLSKMEEIAKGQNAMDIWVSPAHNSQLGCMMRERGYQVRERFTALVDLTRSEDDIWKNLKGETRSQIRQGKKFGLETVEATNEAGLETFYDCLKSVAQRTAMLLPPRCFFDTVFESLSPRQMLRVYAVRHEGQVVASALFLYYKHTLVARYWAAHKEALPLRPYHVLIWHILVEAKRLGFTTCDFGGMPPNQANGIYKFKKGWGVEIKHVDWYVKPLGYGRAVKLAQRALACFPIGLRNERGEACADP